MGLDHLIVFCGCQTLLLLLFLSRKRFRTTPNKILLTMLTFLLGHYVFFYLMQTSIIKSNSPLSFHYPLFGLIPPVIIYYYGKSVMRGELTFSLKSLKHLVPLSINVFFYIIYLTLPQWQSTAEIFAYEVMSMVYIAYPLVIIKKLCDFYQFDHISIKVFTFNKEKTSMIHLMIKILLIHGVILLLKTNLPIIWPQLTVPFDIINLLFVLVFAYILTYVIISVPQTIYTADERVGLSGFKKYEKSSLTRAKAKELADQLNELMIKEKLYLQPDLNLNQLSKHVGHSSHTVSEILNGLIGQTFNDYVNNFRIEEFKNLAQQPKFRDYTILALAFEVGFKSKATFNASFKKITHQTPSQYLKSVRKKQ